MTKKSNLFVFFILIIFGCKDNNITETTVGEPERVIILLEPANNSLSYSDSPTLKWRSYSGALSYRLKISFDANFAGIILKDTIVYDTSYTLPQQTNFGFHYYWKVGVNISGNSNLVWSETWRFRLILPSPEPPVLIEPANNATGQSFMPVFRWLLSPGAQHYRLQISRNTIFTQIVLDSSGIFSTQLNCPELILTSGSLYYWRVNASNSNGLSTSPWSIVFNFTTAEGIPPFTISGKVRFVDSSFSKNEYRLLIFDSWKNPGNKIPIMDTLINPSFLKNNELFYSFCGLPSGNYFLAVGIGKFLPYQNIILGIYGCDTARIPFSTCPLNPPSAQIINGNGLVNINFLSWADTAKKIFP